MKLTLPVFLLLLSIASCTYTIKIKDAKTAMERKQYALAIPMLDKDYAKAKTRIEKGKIAMQLGEAYKQTHNEGKTMTWFKTAFDNGAGVDALKEYAYAQKNAEHYKEAVETFKQLGQEIGSPYEYRREITACNMAQSWLDDLKYASFKVENAPFNSPQNDYSPAMYDQNTVVITSDRNTATGTIPYAWTGKPFADLFAVENNTAKNFSSEINGKANEASATFTRDATKMFFVRSGDERETDIQYNKIFYSTHVNNTWTTPEVLPFCKDKVNYVSPSISPDGQTLYFASNDPEGWGGYDIYYCTQGKDGFTEPKLLNRTINTTGNEGYPFMYGDTLYFSSDYHTGMGGWDIFKAYRLKDGSWSQPQNMKAPINSGADDFGFIITGQSDSSQQSTAKNQKLIKGYFTSNRIGGKGGDDVYSFEQIIPPPRPVVVKLDTPKTTNMAYKNILEVTVVEKILASADNPNSAVLGRKPLAGSSVNILLNGKNKMATVNEEGMLTIALDSAADYKFTASKQNYLNNSAFFSSKGLSRDPNNPTQKYELEIVLDKIYKNREIVLQNIYYDYDKWAIRDDAKPTLNQLTQTLTENPQIKIQLSSHTDCRGRDDYNETLSQKRAESAVAYLISRGIESARLIAKGYGESQPAVSCECTKCTEEQHQQNRRTTFKVLE